MQIFTTESFGERCELSVKHLLSKSIISDVGRWLLLSTVSVAMVLCTCVLTSSKSYHGWSSSVLRWHCTILASSPQFMIRWDFYARRKPNGVCKIQVVFEIDLARNFVQLTGLSAKQKAFWRNRVNHANNLQYLKMELSFRIPYHFLHLLCKCMGRSLKVPIEIL